MEKENIVVLTGAGISAESGISTFRDSGGLWENMDVMEVASIEGWYKDQQKVLSFYNDRRRQLEFAEPNLGHLALADLEEKFNVCIITQNVDNLHERAGSSHIIHLHGELTKIRPDGADEPVVDIGYRDVDIGDLDEKGRQMRPHIVWFGEPVPMMQPAAAHVAMCDLFLIVGTSLAVYPAAGLVDLVPVGKPVYLIDPYRPDFIFRPGFRFMQEKAASGVPKIVKKLLSGGIGELWEER